MDIRHFLLATLLLPTLCPVLAASRDSTVQIVLGDSAGAGTRQNFSADSGSSATHNPAPDSTPDVRSPQDSLRLGEVDRMTVTASRPRGTDIAASPTVIPGDRLRESMRATPMEELSQNSADIYVTSKGTGLHGVASGASGGVYIRGLGGSPNAQILVIDDGAPDYQGIFGHPIPDALFPSLIDRIVVVKGGDAVLYGTNALGGAIVIESRWPDSMGTAFESDMAYGSFGTFRERATILSKKGAVDLASAFSAFTTDGHYDGNDGTSLVGQLGVRLHLPASTRAIVRNKIVYVAGADPGPYFAPFSPRKAFEVVRNNFSARFENSAVFNLRAVGWLDVGEHRLWDGFFSRDYTGGATLEGSQSLMDDRVQLLMGIAGDHVDGSALDRTPDTLEDPLPPVTPMSGIAVYGQLSATPLEGLTGILGARLHHSTRYGDVPLYKIGVRWRPIDALELHSRFVKNFRQPTLRELYLPFPVANPDLRPETAFNWDGGCTVQFGNASIGVTVFRSSVIDMIKYFGVWSGAQVVNIDRCIIRGIEGELAWKHLGPLDLFITASGQDVGHFTRQNPESKANARIVWASDGRKGRLEIAASGEWVHGLFMKNYSRESLPDVFFVDGSIRYRTVTQRAAAIEPYCIVRNFLNSRYEYIKYYRMPGVSFLAGLTIKV